MPHRNARLTVYERLLLVERSRAGWSQARIAEQLGVSRGTVSKWMDRYEAEGLAGLEDRSSRPHLSRRNTSAEVEAQVPELREGSRRGQCSWPVSSGSWPPPSGASWLATRCRR